MKYFTYEEVKLLKESRVIITRKHYIYDITDYYLKHPGGTKSILNNLNNNNNDINYKFHSNKGKKIWEKYKIGEYKQNNCLIL